MKTNNFWSEKKVFITGAGGFIGSHLVERLLVSGAAVTALVHYNSRNDWGLLEEIPNKNAENLTVVCGDIRDAFMMRKVIKGHEIVFHLAALIGIPYSYLAPNSYIDTNIQGTANVLQAALDGVVGKVVHTSTSEVYGTAIYTPIDEKHPLQGQSPYSASKIAADMLTQSYAFSFSLPVVILRPFNTYGPRQSTRAIIPTIITQALTLDKIELGSLAPLRDFNYVQNTIDGFLAVASSRFRNAEVFNCASGKQISIKDLVDRIQGILNIDLPIIETELRKRPEKSEVMSLVSNCAKIEEGTGWHSEKDLTSGLRDTIEYLQNHLDSYKTGRYVR